MTLAVEKDVAADPGDVGLLGATRTDRLPDPVQEVRLRSLEGARLPNEEQPLSCD
jgi:hypothetical protein